MTEEEREPRADAAPWALAAVAADFAWVLLLPYLLPPGAVFAVRALWAGGALALLTARRGASETGLGRPAWRAGLANAALVVAVAAAALGLAGLGALAARSLFGAALPLGGLPGVPSGLEVLRSLLLYPVMEEALYRGVLFRPLERRVGSAGAVVLSGVVFQALHLAYGIFWPHYFVGGALLGWSMLRSRSLLFPVLLHALWNGFLLLFWYGAAVSWPPVSRLLSLVG